MIEPTLDTSSPNDPPTGTEIAAARTVVRLSRHLAHALGHVDLTEAQYRVLAMLAEGEAGASGIAGQMALTKPSITALIDGLEERGLVERQPHPSDRRRRTLSITAAGADQLQRADAATVSCLRSIAAHTEESGSCCFEHLGEWDGAVKNYRQARREARAARGDS